LTVQAVAGTYVVLIGMDMKKEDCDGHLGFAIHRTDHQGEEAYWMEGMKTFEATDPGFAPGAKYPTNQHPIQGFTWSDFTAKPGRKYTYRVQALHGSPQSLTPFKTCSVEVTTEATAQDGHNVYFNRGAAASQEFARRFGNVRPDDKNWNDPRWAWLSRGAMEAIEAFVARAADSSWGLRVSAYEFRLDRFADALAAAHHRKADVRILYDGNANPPDAKGKVFPRDDNRAIAKAAGIKTLCTERVTRSDVKSPPISHHKFIALLKGGEPVAVLTGSTNFSRGGVFGQSNVVHVVENAAVARRYLDCWNLLHAHHGAPEHATLKQTLTQANHLPHELPPVGCIALFSPQQDLSALQWYAKLANSANDALFMTFAFGINKAFKAVYADGRPKLRYALLDKLLGPGVKKEQKAAAEAEMLALRKMKENRFAVGSLVEVNSFDRWVKEKLSGLNEHVQYIHDKFMLVDPLGADPMVITGSANFSDASTTDNDENMLVIRGDKRVADIYLGEYMRFWNHYAFREWAAKHGHDAAQQKFEYLDVENKWWRQYFGDTDRSRQRDYFSHGSL
jgi:phosphatidylserine/phosphatidylglycerophosphate/cardiolipin synthase-like enzyme